LRKPEKKVFGSSKAPIMKIKLSPQVDSPGFSILLKVKYILYYNQEIHIYT
jgi:hypothetical protein